jgi:hypothetical protein
MEEREREREREREHPGSFPEDKALDDLSHGNTI